MVNSKKSTKKCNKKNNKIVSTAPVKALEQAPPTFREILAENDPVVQALFRGEQNDFATMKWGDLFDIEGYSVHKNPNRKDWASIIAEFERELAEEKAIQERIEYEEFMEDARDIIEGFARNDWTAVGVHDYDDSHIYRQKQADIAAGRIPVDAW